VTLDDNGSANHPVESDALPPEQPIVRVIPAGDLNRSMLRNANWVTSSSKPQGLTAADAVNIPRPYWQNLDLADLDSWPCEPLRPIIDGILAHGNLASIVAETQTGKTLFGVYLARRLVVGGRLFGKFQITPVDRVLYFVLEDPARRIRERLLDTSHEFDESIGAGRVIFRFAPGFNLADEQMWRWFESCITTDRPNVVVLDTYQKATPGLNSFDDAAQSPLLHKLADFTRRHGITLIVIDHVRKRSTSGGRRTTITIDDLKGTGGKAQNCDVVILMERTKNREGIVFQSFSKDFDVPVRIEVRVAPRGSREEMKFTYVRDLDITSANGGGRRRGLTDQIILEAIPIDDWRSTSAVAKSCGVSESTMRRELVRLLKGGKVVGNGKRGRGRLFRRGSGHGADDSVASIAQALDGF
jgi:hypothetical protein